MRSRRVLAASLVALLVGASLAAPITVAAAAAPTTTTPITPASTAAQGTPGSVAPSDASCGPSTSGVQADRPENVSVTVMTAPGSAFGTFENASDVPPAISAGLVTPAEEGSDGAIAHGDVSALRVDFSEDATAVLDELRNQDGSTPEERFVELVGSPELASAGFDLRVGTGMCIDPVRWAASERAGALDVAVDRTNATLFVALDVENVVVGYADARYRGLTDLFVEVSPPGSDDSFEFERVDVELREVTFDDRGGGEFLLRTDGEARLAGETTVAPGTNLSFEVAEIGSGTVITTVTTRIDRDGRFETTVDLSGVDPGTGIAIRPLDPDLSKETTFVREPTPSPTPTTTPSPTPTPRSTPTPSPTTGATPTATDPAPTAPGFGPLAGLLALVGALLTAIRRR